MDLEPASDDTTFLDRVATLAEIRHSAAGKARHLRFERGCASVPSFLARTRDVGRVLSQAFPPRPGGLAQELLGRRGGAGLSLYCVNPQAILQLADVSRADRAKPARRSLALWAHTVILRPEPSVDRTFGLTVALLGAVSRARKALGANVGCATR